MPYMSYQPSVESAIRNAGRFMAEAAAMPSSWKAGQEMADRMPACPRRHPGDGAPGPDAAKRQRLGGFRVQGKGALQAKKIVDDAKALEEAGAFAILLEMVPDRLCKLITERAENCIIMSLGSGPTPTASC
jgi:3-methyl-2-oxobutanoate hydroxymethyltransferase